MKLVSLLGKSRSEDQRSRCIQLVLPSSRVDSSTHSILTCELSARTRESIESRNEFTVNFEMYARDLVEDYLSRVA